MSELSVASWSSCPLLRYGLVAMLHSQPGLRPAGSSALADSDVLVIAEEVIDADYLTRLLGGQLDVRLPTQPRCVVVADRFDPAALSQAVACGVVSVLDRHTITEERLALAIRVAGDHGAGAPGLLTGQVAELGSARCNSMFTERELSSLRQLADGRTRAEAAEVMGCSPRTVQAMLGATVVRLGLRNRTQMLAEAVRHGLV